jgi:hypothetical protein
LDIRDGKTRASAAYNILGTMYARWKDVNKFDGGISITPKAKDENNLYLGQIQKLVRQGWADASTTEAERVLVLRQIADVVLKHAKVFIEEWVVPLLARQYVSGGEKVQLGSSAVQDPSRLDATIKRFEALADQKDRPADPSAEIAIDSVANSVHLARRIYLRLSANPLGATFGLSNLLAYLAQVYDGFETISPDQIRPPGGIITQKRTRTRARRIRERRRRRGARGSGRYTRRETICG